MCCGQKRRELKVGGADADSALNVRYFGHSAIHLRGQATGRVYEFSPGRPVRAVDPEDARTMLENRLFRLSR